MSARRHLQSLQVASALRASLLHERYSGAKLRGDLMAGLTVGISAIPLSMALAIAIGVPPQHGLYTSLVAGLVMALLGGSRYSVSGPTAAFVIILQPVVQQFGVHGLMLTTLLSGVFILLMALARFDRVLSYIPHTVTFGFTLGIAVVLATLQLPDLLGLVLTEPLPHFYFAKLWQLVRHLPTAHWPTVLVTGVSFAVMYLWPRTKMKVPAHLITLLAAILTAMLLAHLGYPVATVAGSIQYLAQAEQGAASLPNLLPHFALPWQGAESNYWSFAMLGAVLPQALSIALLGALEALLCAVMLQRLTQQRYYANAELLGQGVGNILAPFFGAFSAAPELARSTTNYRAGAATPLAAVIHCGVIALCLLWASPYLKHLPMAGMATLVVIVAWRMCQGRQILNTVRTAPAADVMVFMLCFWLTLLTDMVVAIGSGVVFAALLFMRNIATLTRARDITQSLPQLPEHWRVVKISGPLFFAAADKVFAALDELAKNQQGLIVQMDGVPLLDAGGLEGLTDFIARCKKRQCQLILTGLAFQPLKAMVKAGIKPAKGSFTIYPLMADALAAVAA